MSTDDLTRKARFVYESLLERRIVGAGTLTEYASGHPLGGLGPFQTVAQERAARSKS